jgi:ATP-dependent Clp protease ATP-binding subunit ClpC
MFERFADEARVVAVHAQEEVRLLGHDRIGTEHLLLALLRDKDSETGRLLRAAGVGYAAVRQLVQESQDRTRKPQGHIPFTPRAKRALEQALRVAQRLGQPHIGRPHLLSGLLQVRDSRAVRLLIDLRVDLDALAGRVDSLGTAGHGLPPAQPPSTAEPS